MGFKELDKLARNIPTFTPNPAGGHDVHAYLKDIDFHLNTVPHVTPWDRLYLVRITSSRDVRSFLDRQPDAVKTDYQQLRQAFIREFSDPETDQGLITAMNLKQGRLETPQAYYARLRQAYFGARNEPGMEEDFNFRTLFLRNLHPTVSHHLGVLACPQTMTTQQLRDLAHKAFVKQKMVSEKTVRTPSICPITDHHSELALEGAQQHHTNRLFNNDSRTFQASRGQCNRGSHLGSQPTVKNQRAPAARTPSPEQRQQKTPRQAPSKSKSKSEPATKDKHESQDTDPNCLSITTQTPSPKLLGNLIEKGLARKLYLSITLENKVKLEALVDMGSDLTLISAELFERLRFEANKQNRTLNSQNCGLNVQSYSQTNIRLEQIAPIHLTIGPMSLIHPVYISPMDTYPLLVGKDLLDRFEPLMDFKQLKIWAQVREPLPCQPPRSTEPDCQVTKVTGTFADSHRDTDSTLERDSSSLLCTFQLTKDSEPFCPQASTLTCS
ncbi:hypothetical protein F2P79_016241 [Pimephales promelas]|nr:hypothetical protein F2P79_016241 [Pimephales promelas]